MSDQGDHWQQVHGTYDRVVAAVWEEPELKQRLLQDPRQVFEQYGIPVPADVELRIVENTPDAWYFVVPGRPDLGEGEQLSARAHAADCCC